jgi:catechol 2,3-dioxygenase-like lactoylglutathione lyase family enzyme
VFKGIHHVAVIVHDLDAARDFYERVLELPMIDRPPFGVPGVWYALGEQQLHIAMFADDQPSPRAHFAIDVDDLDSAVRRIEASGVNVNHGPKAPGAGRQASVRDPSGNLIELSESDRE